jgi:hypothetical protein
MLLLFAIASRAQEKERIKFSVITQLGFLHGPSGNYAQGNFVSGIRYKTWTAGLGFGLDYYYLRSVPLFADLRKYLNKKDYAPFIYLDLGSNYPWIKRNNEKIIVPGFYSSTYDAGIYMDAGIGYRLKYGNAQGIVLSLGFSQKKLRDFQVAERWGPWTSDEVYRYEYKLQRLSFKAGFAF